MDQAFIEVQISGIWLRMQQITNNSQLILNAMQQQQQAFPDNRIRAVDTNRRVLDIL